MTPPARDAADPHILVPPIDGSAAVPGQAPRQLVKSVVARLAASRRGRRSGSVMRLSRSNARGQLHRVCAWPSCCLRLHQDRENRGEDEQQEQAEYDDHSRVDPVVHP